VAELGTSKWGGTISQLGCSTSVACHGSPRKQQQQMHQSTGLGSPRGLISWILTSEYGGASFNRNVAPLCTIQVTLEFALIGLLDRGDYGTGLLNVGSSLPIR
jgi:hypothetical protein